MSDNLITDYQIDLVEDHHSPGSGRYGLRLRLPADISVCFPYLNAILEDTLYDQENGILIRVRDRRRLAFRRHEIQLGIVQDRSEAPAIAGIIVEMVNSVWQDRDHITPSFVERKLPPVYDLYKSLPRTNCRQCGYSTCLAFAADLRNGKVNVEKCLPLSQTENSERKAQLMGLLRPGVAT